MKTTNCCAYGEECFVGAFVAWRALTIVGWWKRKQIQDCSCPLMRPQLTNPPRVQLTLPMKDENLRAPATFRWEGQDRKHGMLTDDEALFRLTLCL